MKKEKLSADDIQRKYGTGKYKKKRIKDNQKIEDAEIKIKMVKNKKVGFSLSNVDYPFLRLYVVVGFIIFVITMFSVFKLTNVEKVKPQLFVDNTKKELVNGILIKENIPYISFEDIKKIFSKDSLNLETENRFVIFGEKKTVEFFVNKNSIYVNGVHDEIKNQPIVMQDDIYLDIENLVKVFDNYKILVSKKFAIFIDTPYEDDKQIKLKEDVFLKKTKSILSENILKLEKNKTYKYIDESKSYFKIRTKEGDVGYINKKSAENVIIAKEKEEKQKEKKLTEKDINIIKEFKNPSANFDLIKKEKDKININIVDAVNFKIEKNLIKVEKIIDPESKAYSEYYKKIENEDMIPALNVNIDNSFKNMLSSYNFRKEFIWKIIEEMKRYKMQGINISFDEEINIKDINRIVLELKPYLRANNISNIYVEIKGISKNRQNEKEYNILKEIERIANFVY